MVIVAGVEPAPYGLEDRSTCPLYYTTVIIWNRRWDSNPRIRVRTPVSSFHSTTAAQSLVGAAKARKLSYTVFPLNHNNIPIPMNGRNNTRAAPIRGAVTARPRSFQFGISDLYFWAILGSTISPFNNGCMQRHGVFVVTTRSHPLPSMF